MIIPAGTGAGGEKAVMYISIYAKCAMTREITLLITNIVSRSDASSFHKKKDFGVNCTSAELIV